MSRAAPERISVDARPVSGPLPVPSASGSWYDSPHPAVVRRLLTQCFSSRFQLRGSSRLRGALLRSLVLATAGSASVLWLLPAPGQANMMQQIIVAKCAEAMQADFDKAGKTPLPGMVDFTCNCVADGMLQRRQSLDQAKAYCTTQAKQKYGQP